jgi:hypothetical protein
MQLHVSRTDDLRRELASALKEAKAWGVFTDSGAGGGWCAEQTDAYAEYKEALAACEAHRISLLGLMYLRADSGETPLDYLLRQLGSMVDWAEEEPPAPFTPGFLRAVADTVVRLCGNSKPMPEFSPQAPEDFRRGTLQSFFEFASREFEARGLGEEYLRARPQWPRLPSVAPAASAPSAPSAPSAAPTARKRARDGGEQSSSFSTCPAPCDARFNSGFPCLYDCGKVSYCTQDHRTQGWPAHKADCAGYKATRGPEANQGNAMAQAMIPAAAQESSAASAGSMAI